MSLPSINQVRHLFVAKTLVTNTAPAAVGDLKVCGTAGKLLFVQHFGHGGLTASDKIDVDKIAYARLTPAANLKTALNQHVITVTEAEAGQVYKIKLQFSHYIGLGEQDITYRIGIYKAKKNDTAALIAAGLAKSLQDALGLDAAANAASVDHYKERLCTVTVSGAAITVKEVEQPWELGRFPVAYIPIRVFLENIYTDDEYATNEWATVVSSAMSPLDDGIKKEADLEYFCMGARGDEYRGMGFPRNIVTKYIIDPSAATRYDILDIHYFYQGSNEAVQKSEKDLTILVATSESSDLVDAIEAIIGEDAVEEVAAIYA